MIFLNSKSRGQNLTVKTKSPDPLCVLSERRQQHLHISHISHIAVPVPVVVRQHGRWCCSFSVLARRCCGPRCRFRWSPACWPWPSRRPRTPGMRSRSLGAWPSGRDQPTPRPHRGSPLTCTQLRASLARRQRPLGVPARCARTHGWPWFSDIVEDAALLDAAACWLDRVARGGGCRAASSGLASRAAARHTGGPGWRRPLDTARARCRGADWGAAGGALVCCTVYSFDLVTYYNLRN